MANPSNASTNINRFVFETSVLSGADDAEERASGAMVLKSTDLDLSTDRLGNGGVDQKIGIRFTGIDIPPGAVITGAYLQFHADEVSSSATSLLIQAEDTDDAAGFLGTKQNISSRPTTDASTTWTPDPWAQIGEAGLAQRTPDLSPLVQEVIDRPEWLAGNGMAFIISGTGRRVAEAFEGAPGSAPALHIEWAPAGTDVTAPTVVMEGLVDGSHVSGTIRLDASASDDVGVTGVRFLVDGDIVGNIDASAPYAVALDTTQLSDGTVALSAVATDAAGNESVSAPVTVIIDNGPSEPPPPPPPSSGTIRVPHDFATIQKAVDAAGNGDTILVGPGTYAGGIVISGKSITITSLYQVADDPSLVERTIIQGGSPGISVDDSAPNTTIAGLHFVGGRDGVEFFAQGGRILDNFFDHVGSDSISFERVGGLARGNLIVGAGDDGVDVDAASRNVLLANNTIRLSGDDGIEIRNQNYHGPLVTLTMRGNTISGSDEDGIQLIDYSELSDRAFVIEDNVIRGSTDVGLGIMDNGETKEDFRGASMPERVDVSNNTFDDNRYGITGGDNLTAVNNTISNSEVGLKNVDGGSSVTGTRFINNETDYIHSNVFDRASAPATLRLEDVVEVSDKTDLLVTDGTAGADGANRTAERTGDRASGIGVSGAADQSIEIEVTPQASP